MTGRHRLLVGGGLGLAALGWAGAAAPGAGALGDAGPLPRVALAVALGLAVAGVSVAPGGAGVVERGLWGGLVAGLLALHLAPRGLPIHWGVDTWVGLARGWQLLLLAGIAAVALAGRPLLARGLAAPSGRSRPWRWSWLAAAPIVAAVAWSLRTNVDLGDSWAVLDVTSAGRDRLVLFPRWPLTSATLGAAYRLLHPWLSARDTVALVSVAAGGAGAALAVRLLARLYPDTARRWMAGAFLISTYGVLQPVFGYIEVYPLALLALVGFVTAATATLQGAPLWWAGLAGGVAFTAYIPLVVPIAPALAVLTVERWRRGAAGLRAVATAGLAGLLPVGLVYGWLWLRDVPGGGWEGFAGRIVGSLNLGWGGSWLIFVPLDRLVTATHGLHVLNEWLLIDATGLALVAAGLARGGPGGAWADPPTRLYAAMLLPTLVYTGVMYPLRPPAEDWDLFAHASLLTAILGPYLLARRAAATPRWCAALAALLLAVNLGHTVPRLLAAHVAPAPPERFPDVFGVGAALERAGLRYVLTDKDTDLYLRGLLRGVRSAQFSDTGVTALGDGFDLTVTGAFVLRPAAREVLVPNFAALGAAYREIRVGDYAVYHGFAPPAASPVPLPRARWRASASHQPEAAARAIDGDTATGWASGAPQAPGLWIQVDLGQTAAVAGVRLRHGRVHTEYPRGLRVSVAVEPGRWREVLTVPLIVPRLLGRLEVVGGRFRFSDDTTPGGLALGFPPVRARRVRLTALAASSSPWSVAELELLGPAR